MSGQIAQLWALLRGDAWAGRIVPPEGQTGWLVPFLALATGAIAALAVVVALTARAETARWRTALAQGATIALPLNAEPSQRNRALVIAQETPGVIAARPIAAEDVAEALAPWIGDGLSLEGLSRPGLIALEVEEPFDAGAFRLRLSGELPGATLDDHGRWQGSLNQAARHVERLAFAGVVLSALLMAALITLATETVLARQRAVLQLLRQIGTQDAAIARAFVRRLVLASLGGISVGCVIVLIGFALWPSGQSNALVAAPRPSGVALLWLGLVPLIGGGVALVAARAAVFRRLHEVS